jgi:hypothetical protein
MSTWLSADSGDPAAVSAWNKVDIGVGRGFRSPGARHSGLQANAGAGVGAPSLPHGHGVRAALVV